jgi:hypothetical protein
MTNKELILLLSKLPEDLEVHKAYNFYTGRRVFENELIDEAYVVKTDGKEVIFLD